MNAAHEQSNLEELTLARSLTLSALVTFPAATACILGVIYAVGAITRSAELSRAGVPVTVAFPLLPIPQELARGIQIFVSPGVLILALVLVALLVFFDFFIVRLEQMPAETSWQGKLDRFLRKHHRILAFVAFLLLAGWILWRPLFLAMILLATLAVVLVLMLAAPEGKRHNVFRRGQRVRISPVLIITALVLGLSVASVFAELVDPQSLPRTTLFVEQGTPITGPLVAIADGNWYLGGSGHQVRAVDARTVRSAVIVAVPRRHSILDESLFQLIRYGV